MQDVALKKSEKNWTNERAANLTRKSQRPKS